jgi:predicted Zn finger-like uncharacterized protein
MSFATRCTACGTIFRVVQDQLRVSEGWVRCGRCAEVFDAHVQLFDIDRDVPPAWPQPEIASKVNETKRASGASTSDRRADSRRSAADEDEVDTNAFGDAEPGAAWSSARQPKPDVGPADDKPEFEVAAIVPPGRVWTEPEPEPGPEPNFQNPAGHADPHPHAAPPKYSGDARLEPQWVDVQAQAATEVKTSIASIRRHAANLKAPAEKERLDPPAIAAASAANALPPNAAAATPTPVEPSFMREFKRENRWRKPGVRAALSLSSLLFLALLGLLVTHHFHNAIAALYPAAKPGLQLLCQVSACELQPWQRLAAIHVESSNLSQTATGNHYRLTVILRNKSAVNVAVPWIELSLTDASGALVARRMLAPKEMNATTDTVALGAELPLKAVLATGAQRISGYSIEVFHP